MRMESKQKKVKKNHEEEGIHENYKSFMYFLLFIFIIVN